MPWKYAGHVEKYSGKIATHHQDLKTILNESQCGGSSKPTFIKTVDLLASLIP
jgi:hypothetical protein